MVMVIIKPAIGTRCVPCALAGGGLFFQEDLWEPLWVDIYCIRLFFIIGLTVDKLVKIKDIADCHASIFLANMTKSIGC